MICMEEFINKAPRDIVQECILLAYKRGFEGNSSTFLQLLLDACGAIVGFHSIIQGIASSHILMQFTVHHLLLYLPPHGNTNAPYTPLNELIYQFPAQVIPILITALYGFCNNTPTLITSPSIAHRVLMHLHLHSESMTATQYNQMNELSQHLQAQMSVVTYNITVWLGLKTPQEQEAFITGLIDIKNTNEGRRCVQTLVNAAFQYLQSATISENEVRIIIHLMDYLLSQKLINEQQLSSYLWYICAATTSNSNRLMMAANLLFRVVTNFMKQTPQYIQFILSDGNVLKTPHVYEQLVTFVRTYINPVETSHMDPASPVYSPAETMSARSRTPSDQIKKLREMITREIIPVEAEPIEVVPDDRVKNRVSVLSNNVTVESVNTKVNDFLELVAPEYETWFADYLVRSRCERQTIFHKPYLMLVLGMIEKRNAHLMDEVLRLSIHATRELLTCEHRLFMEQHTFLKNLGEWLGLLTIGRDVCLSQLHLNLNHELLIAFYHKRLLYVYEFVCYLLRAAKTSQVIRPPQPWLMALMSLLRELAEVPGIQKKIGYVFDNYLDFMGYARDFPMVESDVYLAIPEVANNPDFSEQASQAEVVQYFARLYPYMMESASEMGMNGNTNQAGATVQNAQNAQNAQNVQAVNAQIGSAEQVEEMEVPKIVIPEEIKQSFSPKEVEALKAIIENAIALLVKNYEEKYCNLHYDVVLKSVVMMYLRDLCQVEDMNEVKGYLTKNARSILDNLLLTITGDMERDLLNHLYARSNNALTKEQLYMLAASNTPLIIFRARMSVFTPIVEELNKIINTNERGELRARAAANTLPDMTKNEKVVGGKLTAAQKAIYEPVAVDMQAGMLSEERLDEISVYYYKLQIVNYIDAMIKNEMACIAENAPISEEIHASDFAKLRLLFDKIKGYPQAFVDPRFSCRVAYYFDRAEYALFPFLLRIAKVFQEYGAKDLPRHFTEGVLRIPQNALTILPFLARDGFLDMSLYDQWIAQQIQEVEADTELLTYLFSSLSELVLIREYVHVNQIPLTLRTLEERVAREKEGNNGASTLITILEKLHAKQKVFVWREKLAADLQTEAFKELEEAIKQALTNAETQGEKDIFVNDMPFAQLVNITDAKVNEFGVNGPFIVLYGWLQICYAECLVMTDPKEMARHRNRVCRVLGAVFAELVRREEEEEDRVLVFAAELEAVMAFLFVCHDHDSTTFTPQFFLRVFMGFVKEIIYPQSDMVRIEMMQRLAILLRSISPVVMPNLHRAWLELLSMPQFLSLMLGEYPESVNKLSLNNNNNNNNNNGNNNGNANANANANGETTNLNANQTMDTTIPKVNGGRRRNAHLVFLMGDLVVRLFSYVRTTNTRDHPSMNTFATQAYNFVELLLRSFPGVLCMYASTIAAMMDERMVPRLLNDLPEEMNWGDWTAEEWKAYMTQAWTTPIEINAYYKQELSRNGVLEAATNALYNRRLEDSLLFILQKLGGVNFLRSLIHFWVREEGRLRNECNETRILHPEQILLKMLSLHYDEKLVLSTIHYLAEFIRFPCYETQLFLETFCEMYRNMNEEFKNHMVDELYNQKDKPFGNFGPTRTLQALQQMHKY